MESTMEEEGNRNGHNSNGVSSLTPRDVLAIVFRHRRLIVNSFLGILCGAILVAVLQPHRYEAGMKILVKRERSDPVATSEGSAQPQAGFEVTEEELNSELELLKSRDLLEKIVLACDLPHHQNDWPWSQRLAANRAHAEPGSPEENTQIARAVVALQKQLKVEVVKKTNLIVVRYESRDPELAARVLTTLANQYLEKHVAVHRPPGAFDFFHQESEQYRKGLSDAEARLVNFSHAGTVVSAQLQKEVALQKLAEFEATQGQTEASIADTQQRIAYLEQQAASIPDRIVTQVRKSDDGTLLSQLRSNLLALELKRTALLEKFEPSYRPVQELGVEIAQTRAALTEAEKSQLREETTDRAPTYDWVTEELAKAKADLAGLRARAKVNAQTLASYQRNAQLLGRQEIVQNDLLRTVKATEGNYLFYLRKEEEVRMSEALDRRRILNVAVAEAATVPSLPSNRRSATVIAGLLLAIVTSVGLAFVSEYLDPTFRTPDELRSFLNVPVLAAMPGNGRNGKYGRNGAADVSRVL
jgi:uncharacterized protein involved in exopolysaccharide biosynthesis